MTARKAALRIRRHKRHMKCNARALLAATAAWSLTAGAVFGSADAEQRPWTPADREIAIHALVAAGERQGPDLNKLDDPALELAVVRYAVGELGEQIRPQIVDPMWALAPQPRDIAADLDSARATGKLEEWLRSLPVGRQSYSNLEAARRRYQAIVANGGWPQIDGRTPLSLGDENPQVSVLRARLTAEGYGAGSADEPDKFDTALQAAIAEFQQRHGLADTGRLDAPTRAALTVTAQERLGQIRANLERLRWVPRDEPPDRIEVDIAGARARLLEGGKPTLTMKVVVGDPRHRTPMFASRVDAVIFNPPWRVPQDIARKEILPKAARHHDYLARNDFIFVGGRLEQKAGPKSALGAVKFDLQSPFGIYLHDTPDKTAFERRMRDLSHGCMRLEKPEELAVHLLAPQGWTEGMVFSAIGHGGTRRVPLKAAIPVYVVYRTAVADPEGRVDFRPDVYGWDQELILALEAADARRGRAPSVFSAPAAAAAGEAPPPREIPR